MQLSDIQDVMHVSQIITNAISGAIIIAATAAAISILSNKLQPEKQRTNGKSKGLSNNVALQFGLITIDAIILLIYNSMEAHYLL